MYICVYPILTIYTYICINTDIHTIIYIIKQNSKIAVNLPPQCYVDSGICKVTWQPDALRTASLYVPAQLALSLVYIGLVYEIPFLDINPVLSLLIGEYTTLLYYMHILYTTQYCAYTDINIYLGRCSSYRCILDNNMYILRTHIIICMYIQVLLQSVYSPKK